MHKTRERLPFVPLVALSLTAFIAIVTEALPAGLLTPMSLDLRVSAAAAGQSVTVYAIGSLLAAIPVMVLLQGMRRRRLLLLALAGFTLANRVTAWSPLYGPMLVARGVAGMAAGVLWALLAGYAASMVAAHNKGKAIAVAMAGTPLALSLGLPLGTYAGNLLGWRVCFVLPGWRGYRCC
jgi:predicted MFS family arabinose efflux permease